MFGVGDPNSLASMEEFRKQYGVDIRREEFDRNAWRQMRGRHLTQFLRLLKKQLAAHGKQIAVCVHGQHPEKPMQWNVDGGVQTAGNFRWSVDDWLKGDVVDEIDLFTPASDAIGDIIAIMTRNGSAAP